jgi:hypothetical protein
MEQIMYDEKLTTIKAFHTYLGDVITKGYNNNYDTLSYIVKHINNFQDEIIEESARNEPSLNESNMFNYEYNLSSSSSSSSNNTTEDEDDNNETNIERLQKEKELQKIKKFLDGPDLSKIYLYKKNNKFVIQMENFIKKSYLY